MTTIPTFTILFMMASLEEALADRGLLGRLCSCAHRIPPPRGLKRCGDIPNSPVTTLYERRRNSRIVSATCPGLDVTRVTGAEERQRRVRNTVGEHVRGGRGSDKIFDPPMTSVGWAISVRVREESNALIASSCAR